VRSFVGIIVINLIVPACLLGQPSQTDARFDLRDYYGDGTTDYTTAVRDQSWGTCWIFGTTAAMESNLTVTGNWAAADMVGEADLAEYHLDKFSGFTRKGMDGDEIPSNSWFTGQGPPFPGSNTDEPLATRTHGLIVHLGGDYRIATAYLVNHGAVNETLNTEIIEGDYPAKRVKFGYSDTDGIPKCDDSYVYFIPRHIEWHTLSGTDAEKRQRIKQAVISYGSVGTCMYWGGGFYSEGTHYQPVDDENLPNHAVAIVGWDDDKATQAEFNGAWLCRNSWGDSWGEYGDGHFWISYYDKHTARHPEMGGVTFRDVDKVSFDAIYSHSLHGWQYDTSGDPAIAAAANRFVAEQSERLKSVGFYTIAEDVSYTVRIHRDDLSSAAVTQISGTMARPGFHKVELDDVVVLDTGQVFFIAMEVDKGGHAFDASFVVETAMGPISEAPQDVYYTEETWDNSYKFDTSSVSRAMGTITGPPYDVYSAAGVNESFYKDASGQWWDFVAYDGHGRLGTEWDDSSWNFAITGYAARLKHGDINKDGSVDSADFAILGVQWGHSTDNLSADIAPEPGGDGIVNERDLQVLAECWLTEIGE